MKTYSISIRYSRDGKSWSRTTITVKAESDYGAIEQAKTRYPHVTEVRIISVR